MRILIAEDDEALAKFVRQGLEGEHYSVDVLSDGEQARTAATEFEYDVVILDLNLPKLDGVSVLRHLRTKKPSVPVLVLTQRTRVEDRVQCLDTGADDYVPKQLSPTSLDIIHIRQDLIRKIRAAAQSRPSHSPLAMARKPSQSCLSDAPPRCAIPTPAIVAMGISTGGPKALQGNLAALSSRSFGSHCDRATHAPGLYHSLRPATQHAVFGDRTRGMPSGLPSAWRRLHCARRNSSESRATLQLPPCSLP